MKRVLLDINVILDVLLARQPHFAASSAVWAAVENGRVDGLVEAHAVTTIEYLARKQLGAAKARRIVGDLLRVFGVAPIDKEVLADALALGLSDFEDSVTAASARATHSEAIVTRDLTGFRQSPIRALTPEAAAHIIGRVT